MARSSSASAGSGTDNRQAADILSTSALGPAQDGISGSNSGLGGTDGGSGAQGGTNGVDSEGVSRKDRPKPKLRKLTTLKPPDHGPHDDPFYDRLPALAALLYDGSFSECKPRDPARIKLVCRGGFVTLTLECPTEGQKVTATGDTFDKAFATLEWFCAHGVGPWEELRWGTGAIRRKDLRKKELDKKRVLEENE